MYQIIMTSPSEMAVGPWSLYGGLLKRPFDYTAIAGSGKVGLIYLKVG